LGYKDRIAENVREGEGTKNNVNNSKKKGGSQITKEKLLHTSALKKGRTSFQKELSQLRFNGEKGKLCALEEERAAEKL